METVKSVQQQTAAGHDYKWLAELVRPAQCSPLGSESHSALPPLLLQGWCCPASHAHVGTTRWHLTLTSRSPQSAPGHIRNLLGTRPCGMGSAGE